MKTFLLADSRLISASWAQKRLILSFYTCSGSSSWKIFFSTIRASWYLLDSFLPHEPKNVWSKFLHMFWFEFMKSFLHADSSELMAVRLLSACWAQKRLILTFWTWCTSSSWKIVFSSIQASWWLLDSFRPPELKNVWFLLSTNDVRRAHEKFSSRRFEPAADSC